MATHKASGGRRHGTVTTIDFGNQLLDQGRTTRPVASAIGIHMMPPLALSIQHHADELGLTLSNRWRTISISSRHRLVSTTETGDHVEHRVATSWLAVVRLRKNHRCCLQYLVAMKS